MRVLALLCAVAAVASGCRREPRKAPSASAAPEVTRPSAAARSPAVASALTELSRAVTSVTPRTVPSQTLAFGKATLLRIAGSEIVAHAASDGRELARWAVASPRHVVALADGAVLIVGAAATERWEPGRVKPESFARVPVFAETVLFGDRVRPPRFWLQPGFGPTLYGFELTPERVAGLLPIQRTVTAEGFERGAFSSLRDGSFLYWAEPRLRRFFAGGRVADVAVPGALKPWRILPTGRLDRLWVVDPSGALVHAELGQRLRELGRTELGRVPFDAAGTARDLAIVTVSKSRGADDFVLDVYDPKGRRRFQTELPRDEPAAGTPDVILSLTRNQNLALSELEPLVAVGGPDRACVWQTEQGQRLWCVERAAEAPVRPSPL